MLDRPHTHFRHTTHRMRIMKSVWKLCGKACAQVYVVWVGESLENGVKLDFRARTLRLTFGICVPCVKIIRRAPFNSLSCEGHELIIRMLIWYGFSRIAHSHGNHNSHCCCVQGYGYAGATPALVHCAAPAGSLCVVCSNTGMHIKC